VAGHRDAGHDASINHPEKGKAHPQAADEPGKISVEIA
jgi:hypothetical protein